MEEACATAFWLSAKLASSTALAYALQLILPRDSHTAQHYLRGCSLALLFMPTAT